MEIIKNASGSFEVVNMFGQMIDCFADYNSAFDYLIEFGD